MTQAFSHRAIRGWLCSFALIATWTILSLCDCQAQVESAAGIKRFSKNQWTILTDLPIDQEIESWPSILDQALATWCQKWSIDPAVAKSWPLTIHCIGDRKLFEQAGLLDQVPAFDDGFQMADRVFLVEQPSNYYRRHLLLHEATHWIMYRAFGGGGAPWFMEGMAELEATHRLDKNILSLAIIPDRPESVPHWGRFKKLSDSIAANGVPKLKRIIYYGNERQDRMDRYCWSWAACVFLRNHPLYWPFLDQSSTPPLDYSLKLSKQFEKSLADRWDDVERDWKLFVDEFGFGYQPTSDLISIEESLRKLETSEASQVSMQLDTTKGWQLLHLPFKQGQGVNITAQGIYVVQVRNQQAWESTPEGLTYRYHRHIPMGKLIGGFLSVDNDQPLEVFPIGNRHEFKAPADGWLLLRINEPVVDRRDNSGLITIQVDVK
ncbi:MAG: hypothetical protein ACK6AT_04140 [Planctomycetota bacterium]|jgi:hypothetical protein